MKVFRRLSFCRFNKSMIRVLIVDDIKILCQGLELTLKQDNEIEVIGAARNGKEAFEICKNELPDVVLMDMRMPEYDGAYAIELIKETYPQIKILVFTTFDDEDTVNIALSSGADGYILKEMEDDVIISAVRCIYFGVNVFGSTVFSMVKNVTKYKQNKQGTVDITQRELKILSYISKGYNNKQISEELYLAEGTVRNGISKLLDKLELKDRTQLAVYAVKNGIE